MLDRNKLVVCYKEYANMGVEEKAKIDARIKSLNLKAYKDFNNNCMRNEELVKMHKQICEIDKILNYDIKNDYCANKESILKDGSNITLSDYDEISLKTEKAVAENWSVKKAEYEKNINDLKTKKIVFSRASKIRELEEEFESKKVMAEHYLSCKEKLLAKEKLSQDMKENPMIYKNLNFKYNGLVVGEANAIVEKYLTGQPFMISGSYDLSFAFSKDRVDFSNDVLNASFISEQKVVEGLVNGKTSIKGNAGINK